MGSGRKRWGVREGGRKDVKDSEKDMKGRERSEEGGRGCLRDSGVPRPSRCRGKVGRLLPPAAHRILQGRYSRWLGEEGPVGGKRRQLRGRGKEIAGDGQGSAYLWLRPALPRRPHSRRGSQAPAPPPSPPPLGASLPPLRPSLSAQPAAHSVFAPGGSPSPWLRVLLPLSPGSGTGGRLFGGRGTSIGRGTGRW